jgi:hypothetical protein
MGGKVRHDRDDGGGLRFFADKEYNPPSNCVDRINSGQCRLTRPRTLRSELLTSGDRLGLLFTGAVEAIN